MNGSRGGTRRSLLIGYLSASYRVTGSMSVVYKKVGLEARARTHRRQAQMESKFHSHSISISLHFKTITRDVGQHNADGYLVVMREPGALSEDRAPVI